jgi:hypothetical protein
MRAIWGACRATLATTCLLPRAGLSEALRWGGDPEVEALRCRNGKRTCARAVVDVGCDTKREHRPKKLNHTRILVRIWFAETVCAAIVQFVFVFVLFFVFAQLGKKIYIPTSSTGNSALFKVF